MTDCHVGFSGTRNGTTEEQYRSLVAVFDALELLDGPVFIHHGDCVGSDEEAHWLALARDFDVITHPPLDDKLRAYRDDAVATVAPRPYLTRNRGIANGTDELIATPSAAEDDPSSKRSGTWYTIRYAVKTGKPVRIIHPDGTIEKR